ncbi:LysM peptidoglycan-binding domain-containing protein [Pseudomethylobacillus aquaticus]|uniref:LysM peptidoglycan-binding domain-containing protein n=1 Tax=Pseudomethylobacillus aquaticus TaxID=2676064 RepID=A0A3N0V5U8_9PROT|nr:LysM peptidoglycan-binding domain-containing protein [Pseudomethylobacillus aquaticus]ROH87951.1 LysM peptidoglycan-binding domain-containing protein [Pseudomethylobacillus aquaticus]
MKHVVTRGGSLVKIAKRYKVSLNALLAANPVYKANPDLIKVGDEVIIPPAAETIPSTPDTANEKPNTGRAETVPEAGSGDPFRVGHGQLTFDAEGQETPGPYFSRSPHVPGPSSGVTIGRGYDLKHRSTQGVAADLHHAAIAPAAISALTGCCGLQGVRARQYLEAQGLLALTITPAQQKALFMLVYAELEGDVMRICNKADVVDKFGAVHWRQLSAKLRDVVVDLRYRGDYTPATREYVQPLVVANDMAGMARLMADHRIWMQRFTVPRDRFLRRRDYLAD